MTLRGFSAEQLASLEHSLLLEGEAKGVRFTLADVRSEMRRRQKNRFDPGEVAFTILTQVAASEDGRTTYGELWKSSTAGQSLARNEARQPLSR